MWHSVRNTVQVLTKLLGQTGLQAIRMYDIFNCSHSSSDSDKCFLISKDKWNIYQSTRGTKVTYLWLSIHLVPNIRLNTVSIGTKSWIHIWIYRLLISYDCYPLLITKPSLRLLDHWLKWIRKSFSIFLSHVQSKNIASSNSLLPLKVSLEKTILFLCCHIVHVRVIHQHFHILTLIPPAKPFTC